MAKVGDKVRFLNDVGGGVIKRIDGKVAYVDDGGFETPALIKDLVVVLPAGHEALSGANLMFDQKAFDEGRRPEQPEPKPEHKPEPKPEDLPIEETEYGNKINVALAFEPADVKQLSKTKFNAVLVNDSNYFLNFSFLSRLSEARNWQLVFSGEVAPNELIDLNQYSHETIGELEQISLQGIFFKKEKPFELKAPLNITRKLDLTKFYKLHSFGKSLYFDTPVLEISLIKDDIAVGKLDFSGLKKMEVKEKEIATQLSEKFRVDSGRHKKNSREEKVSPSKLLPLIEVDLHINELLDSTAGMDNTAMLQHQLDVVRKVMNDNRRRIGQKIVFIHGKGEGVLRKAVLALLRKEFPKSETQDASFREYGFGATLVTIH